MNNSEVFKAAHKAASRTVRIVGDYRIAFSLALKMIIKTAKLAKQLNSFTRGLFVTGGMNAGKNDYEILVRIFDETAKINKPKKQSFNWAGFDDSESGCY
jgi:hypothetical protein